MKAIFQGVSSADASLLPNDTRCLSAPQVGIYAVVDARGPTYGGWYRPIGVEPAWQALNASLEASALPLEDSVRIALEQANSAAHSTVPDWQERAARAMERKPGGALCHPGLSIALVALRASSIVAAGVGSCRVYRFHAEQWSLLVPGQTLAGADSEPSRDHLRRVASQYIGLSPTASPDLWSGSVTDGDAFFLCSVDVWADCHAEIVNHAGDPVELLALVADRGGNASACVVSV